MLSIPAPAPPTPEQLDEAELAARLVLNQLHADIGEQVTIQRSSMTVEVEGLVETDKRKYELRHELATLPRVHVSIQSLEDVKKASVSETAPGQISAIIMQDQASALQIFLGARGRSVDDSNLIANRLFSTALAISRETEALKELKSRFRSNITTSVLMSATLADLNYSHHERLEAALNQERTLLEVIGPVDANDQSETWHAVSLAGAAARNLALVKELTRTDVAPQRKAPTICAELSAMANQMDAVVRSMYRPPQENAVTSGKD